jgi:hypothetical protein
MITSWQDVFAPFAKSPTKLGKAIGVSRQAANNMMARGSIPPMWWDALIAYAARENINGITYDALGRLAAKSAAPAE